MAKTVYKELLVDWEDMPLGWLARSYDGHVFEIDVNRTNGVVFVRFPSHLPTLRVIASVFCAMSDSCMLDDLLEGCDEMPMREYGGVGDGSPYLMRADDSGLWLENVETGEGVRCA